ncbi:hypothetical protein [Persicitalea jodogahamensis]|uniref:Uncharacterized protein n=1 Tax=Persicitalea jodogahamensis TaxID=402147 RepID=A0A8J3DD65_9BACT|nr:hypothetical protein [Persicitalea jodogahamensis]GHB85075.1 hypothetical protein GCM10007390_45450 [Persicitalea jodogahamensis]
MKSFLVCFLSFNLLIGSLLPGNGWHELAKLPDLVQHYQLHLQKADGDISFLTFLQMHYGAGSEHKGTEDHSKLPCLNLHASVLLYLPTLLVLEVADVKTAVFSRLKNFFWNNLYSFQFKSILLNPPKL